MCYLRQSYYLKGTVEWVFIIIKVPKSGHTHLYVISTELQADVSQDPLDIFPRFPQTAQVIDGELEHSASLNRKEKNTKHQQVYA